MWQYNYQNYDPYELYHYGVRGKKWKHQKKYSDSLFGEQRTISINGRTVEDSYTPGQIDKAYDKARAKKTVRTAVNKTNPYGYNERKSVSSNVKKNVRTFKRRRKLKKAGYKAVDALFRRL